MRSRGPAPGTGSRGIAVGHTALGQRALRAPRPGHNSTRVTPAGCSTPCASRAHLHLLRLSASRDHLHGGSFDDVARGERITLVEDRATEDEMLRVRIDTAEEEATRQAGTGAVGRRKRTRFVLAAQAKREKG